MVRIGSLQFAQTVGSRTFFTSSFIKWECEKSRERNKLRTTCVVTHVQRIGYGWKWSV